MPEATSPAMRIPPRVGSRTPAISPPRRMTPVAPSNWTITRASAERKEIPALTVTARMSRKSAAGCVARLGGDEFAVLLTGIDDEDRAVRVGRRLLR